MISGFNLDLAHSKAGVWNLFTVKHGRPQKFFQGRQSRNFASAYPFRLVDNAAKMDIHEALRPFITKKKTPKVTATVANRVVLLRKFYTEQMFGLACINILRLS